MIETDSNYLIFPPHKLLRQEQIQTLFVEARTLILLEAEEKRFMDSLANYKFVKVLGKGSQSKVYLV